MILKRVVVPTFHDHLAEKNKFYGVESLICL